MGQPWAWLQTRRGLTFVVDEKSRPLTIPHILRLLHPREDVGLTRREDANAFRVHDQGASFAGSPLYGVKSGASTVLQCESSKGVLG
jgi:hypothetical protein